MPTTANVGKPPVIVLMVPISSPIVRQPITDGNAVIRRFDTKEAQDLAVLLRSGPCRSASRIEKRSIGPSLYDSLERASELE